MDEDEVWDAMESLHREGKVEVEPSGDPDGDPGFSLSEHGEAAAKDLLREKDDAVLMVLAEALKNVDRPGDPSNVAEALVDIAKFIRDDVGVNAFRVIQRNPEKAPGISAEDLSEAFIEQFDPDEDDVDEGGEDDG